MKLSIIVPIYNAEKYLNRCLDSLNEQLINGLEIILVNDGSSDKSSEIINNYVFKTAIKKVIHKDNGGITSALREGIKISQGDYIGFVDADDYVSPEMFYDLSNLAEQHKTDIVMCNHFHQTDKGEFIERRLLIKPGLYVGADYIKIYDILCPKLNSEYISPSRVNKIVRRDIVLKSISLLNNSINSGEDNFCTTLWFIDSSSLFLTDKSYYYYCYNNASTSYTYKGNILNQYLVLIKKLNQYNEIEHKIKKADILNLYNFYGFLWCIYVFNSNMNWRNKCKEINRLSKTKEFRMALKYLEKGHMLRKLSYSIAIRLHMPFIVLFALKAHKRRNCS